MRFLLVLVNPHNGGLEQSGKWYEKIRRSDALPRLMVPGQLVVSSAQAVPLGVDVPEIATVDVDVAVETGVAAGRGSLMGLEQPCALLKPKQARIPWRVACGWAGPDLNPPRCPPRAAPRPLTIVPPRPRLPPLLLWLG